MRKGVGVILIALSLGCSRGDGARKQDTAGQKGSAASALSKLPPPIQRPDLYQTAAVWKRQKLAGGYRETAADRFLPGEPIAVYVKAAEVPRGLSATVVITGPGGREIAQSREEIPPESRSVILRFFKTSGWPEGDYNAVILLGGEEVDRKNFRIAAKP